MLRENLIFNAKECISGNRRPVLTSYCSSWPDPIRQWLAGKLRCASMDIGWLNADGGPWLTSNRRIVDTNGHEANRSRPGGSGREPALGCSGVDLRGRGSGVSGVHLVAPPAAACETSARLNLSERAGATPARSIFSKRL